MNSSSPPISSARSRIPDMPKPPSRPSPRGPSRSAPGSPLPSSVTDARIVPPCSLTFTTALVASACLLHDPVDGALQLRVQSPRAIGIDAATRGTRRLGQVDFSLHVQPVDRLRAARERLQGSCQPEVVQRRRAQLGDQMAQAVDLSAQALEYRIHRFAQSLPVVEVARVRQLQAQRADPLDALVVDLPRPAGALVLARLHAEAQPFDLN